MTQSLQISNTVGLEHNHDFVTTISKNFRKAVEERGTKVLKVSSKGLYDLFLHGLPVSLRQRYECSTCRDFVRKYGGLVHVTETAEVISAVWDTTDIPELYRESLELMAEAVKSRMVSGFSFRDLCTLGSEYNITEDGTKWEHMHVHCTGLGLDGNFQDLSVQSEGVNMLNRLILEVEERDIKRMLALFETGTLNQEARNKPIVEWFYDLHTRTRPLSHKDRNSLIWLAIQNLNYGHTHIRSGVIGKFLRNSAKGEDVESLKLEYNSQTDSINYQRTKAELTEDQLTLAGKAMENLGYKPSDLYRRVAMVDEVPSLWTKPQETLTDNEEEGFFDSIKGSVKGSSPVDIFKASITLEKFVKEVLPKAQKIFIVDPNMQPYTYTMPLKAEAKPIFTHDTLESPNPLSGFTTINSTLYSRLEVSYRNLINSTYGLEVDQVSYNGAKLTNLEAYSDYEDVVFLIRDIRLQEVKKPGLALFPELLKSELYVARRAIERWSNETYLEEPSSNPAVGFLSSSSDGRGFRIKVLTDLGWFMYSIKRE